MMGHDDDDEEEDDYNSSNHISINKTTNIIIMKIHAIIKIIIRTGSSREKKGKKKKKKPCENRKTHTYARGSKIYCFKYPQLPLWLPIWPYGCDTVCLCRLVHINPSDASAMHGLPSQALLQPQGGGYSECGERPSWHEDHRTHSPHAYTIWLAERSLLGE